MTVMQQAPAWSAACEMDEWAAFKYALATANAAIRVLGRARDFGMIIGSMVCSPPAIINNGSKPDHK
jgi:hypothetical protein